MSGALGVGSRVWISFIPLSNRTSDPGMAGRGHCCAGTIIEGPFLVPASASPAMRPVAPPSWQTRNDDGSYSLTSERFLTPIDDDGERIETGQIIEVEA